MLFYISPSGTSCHLPHQREALGGSIQHVFDENTISPCGVIYKNVRDRTHQLSILDDGAAAHE